ncbi:uncharacterized protein BDV17DRAFT_290343 [Aspergillus undulatus]|uniref:uncharacterized protein n=1 Tax=Aspergillus undulatus TaxID=1810928 RepID=UPI003CCCBBDA
MHIFHPVDSFDSVFAINRRQTSDSSCGGGGVGTGECLPGDSCRGILYINQCRDTPGDECCLHRECSTPLGGGHCKNRDNQTCDGEYYTGTYDPSEPTCPGPNYILCCVEWDLMNNDTDPNPSTTTTATTLTTSSSTAPTTETPTPTDEDTGTSGDGGSGLSTSAKGGIAGGIVGAVAVTSIVFLAFFFLRRRRKQQKQQLQEGQNVEGQKSEGDSGDRGTTTATETATGANTETGSPRSEGGEREAEMEAAMLASRMKVELDGTGRAVHEMEVTRTRAMATIEEKAEMEQMKSNRRFAELPGTLAVAEMAVESEADCGQGREDGHQDGDGADVKRD